MPHQTGVTTSSIIRVAHRRLLLSLLYIVSTFFLLLNYGTEVCPLDLELHPSYKIEPEIYSSCTHSIHSTHDVLHRTSDSIRGAASCINTKGSHQKNCSPEGDCLAHRIRRKIADTHRNCCNTGEVQPPHRINSGGYKERAERHRNNNIAEGAVGCDKKEDRHRRNDPHRTKEDGHSNPSCNQQIEKLTCYIAEESTESTERYSNRRDLHQKKEGGRSSTHRNQENRGDLSCYVILGATKNTEGCSKGQDLSNLRRSKVKPENPIDYLAEGREGRNRRRDPHRTEEGDHSRSYTAEGREGRNRGRVPHQKKESDYSHSYIAEGREGRNQGRDPHRAEEGDHSRSYTAEGREGPRENPPPNRGK